MKREELAFVALLCLFAGLAMLCSYMFAARSGEPIALFWGFLLGVNAVSFVRVACTVSLLRKF